MCGHFKDLEEYDGGSLRAKPLHLDPHLHSTLNEYAFLLVFETFSGASGEAFSWVSWLYSGPVGLRLLFSKTIKGPFFAFPLGS